MAGTTEVVAHDEVWLTVTDEWWVLCAEADGDQIVSLVLHAAVPVEQTGADRIEWIDLDLDLEVRDGQLSLEDEEQFHRHAATMAYPRDVVRGAWAGISRMAPRYTMDEWPFDGWLGGLAGPRSRAAAVDRGRTSFIPSGGCPARRRFVA